jgi:hypothetical protein
MTNEFKKISNKEETRYVLETATVGGTPSGAVSSIAMTMGGIQRRKGDNLLTPESDTVKQKPRQGPLKTQTGGGKHKDKTKTIPRREKYKKALAEFSSSNPDAGPASEIVSKVVNRLRQKYPGLNSTQAAMAELGNQMDTNTNQEQQISQLVSKNIGLSGSLQEKEKRLQDINARFERGEISRDQADTERKEVEKEYPGVEKQPEPVVRNTDKPKSQEPDKKSTTDTGRTNLEKEKGLDIPKSSQSVEPTQPATGIDQTTNTTPPAQPNTTPRIPSSSNQNNLSAYMKAKQDAMSAQASADYDKLRNDPEATSLVKQAMAKNKENSWKKGTWTTPQMQKDISQFKSLDEPITKNEEYLNYLSNKLNEVLDTAEAYKKKTSGQKLNQRMKKHKDDAEKDVEYTRTQQALTAMGDRMKSKSVSEEVNKEHGSPYDCGGADKWYGRRYNPHKVDWTTGKDIPCETPEEQAEYAAGYRDSETDDDFREGAEKTLSNPQHKLGKDIDAGRKSAEASRIRAEKARAEFNKYWDEKKATEKPGMSESLRPGEYHVWTVHFDDGTTRGFRVPSDEYPDDRIKAYYARKGKRVVKIDYDWGVHNDLDEGVAEGDEYNEYSDEVDMVKNNLLTIIRSCKELANTMKNGENLPEWVEEKVSMSKQNMVTVSQYLQSQHDQGHVYEANRSDVDSANTSVGNQITGGKPVSFSQPTPAKTDTAKSWPWWWGAYIAAIGKGLPGPPYTDPTQINDYKLGRNAANLQVGDFTTKTGMLQLNRPAGPMNTKGLSLAPDVIQRANKLFPDRTSNPTTPAPAGTTDAVSVKNIKNMAMPYSMNREDNDSYQNKLQERLDAEVDERSVSQAQARTMAAAAHNPAFAKKVGIKINVAKEFNRADTGKDISKLPKRVIPKKRKK